MSETERDWLEGNDARTQHEREVEARHPTMNEDRLNEIEALAQTKNDMYPFVVELVAEVRRTRQADWWYQDMAVLLEERQAAENEVRRLRDSITELNGSWLPEWAQAKIDALLGVTGDTGGNDE